MARILVVEDELSIRSFIVINLKRSGHDIMEAVTGEEALEAIREKAFDIVLLDVMLPGVDGFGVCDQIRKKNKDIGIIMLTAKVQEQDKVQGLLTGADDYIPKPFSPSELMARVEALLRRVAPKKADVTYSGIFKLNREEGRLYKEGTIIDVTPTEFHLLEVLVDQANQPISRHELLDKVWGEAYVGDPKIVDVNIRRLRQKIEPDPSCPTYIKTSWGKGYEWKGDTQ